MTTVDALSHSDQLLSLSVADWQSYGWGSSIVRVQQDAIVDDIIACDEKWADCAGFLAVAAQESDYDEYETDEFTDGSSGLAEALAIGENEDGSLLLRRGVGLASVGFTARNTSEVLLFPCWTEGSNRPLVYEKDLKRAGFSNAVFKYVDLNPMDKEMKLALEAFRSSPLGWLANGDSSHQMIELGKCTDEFPVANSRSVLTVVGSVDDDDELFTCTTPAGDVMCTLRLSKECSIADLSARLCLELDWVGAAVWKGSEPAALDAIALGCGPLTAQQLGSDRLIEGAYHNGTETCRPAGYSASGTSSENWLVLEEGKASLQLLFRGDYKRAEEEKSLRLFDGQWCTEILESGEEVVRIVGDAIITKYFCHERSGGDADNFHDYKCCCRVTVPVEQLLSAQKEDHRNHATEGSGWTCGTRDYASSFFLPLPVLSAVRRIPPAGRKFPLKELLHAGEDYPLDGMKSRSRWNRTRTRVEAETIDKIRTLRQALQGRKNVTYEKLLDL